MMRLPETSVAEELAGRGDLPHALLASFYRHLGVGGPKDPEASDRWFDKAWLTGNAEYLCHLGELRERGELVRQDFDAANRAYREAESVDPVKGSYMLAKLAMNRNPANAYESLKSAVGHLRRAAQANHVPSLILLLRLGFRARGRFALEALVKTPGCIVIGVREMLGRRRDSWWRYSDVMNRTRIVSQYIGDDRLFVTPRSLDEVVLDRLAPSR